MLFRAFLALLLSFAGTSSLRAQDSRNEMAGLSAAGSVSSTAAHSAWIDLRQLPAAYSKPQHTPDWVESVMMIPGAPKPGEMLRTVFRIRVSRPQLDLQLLHFRLFFDDKPEQRPTITIWDESGTQLMQSGALGAGIDLPSSDSVLLPMIGVSAIDIEVPGDGKTVRGAFLDWMTSRSVAHPASADVRDIIPEPFAAAAPLKAPEQDHEKFGTVTASLAPEVIRIGASVQSGASFQFGLESQPLMALISFEVASARVDAPPEIYLNGESLGPVAITLPDLADPAFRGESARLIGPMRFHYTGWLRAQMLVPASHLRVGTNNLLIIAGPGTPAAAIRATQIQLKYLWDKSDYVLEAGPQ